MSAISRCPLCRIFGQKKTTEIKMKDFFHTIRINNIDKKYFKIFQYHVVFWYLTVICSTFAPHLTSMKFFTPSSFFNASAAVIFLFSLSSVTVSDSKFLQFTNHHIRVEVTRKRVNRAVGLGLKIPVNCFLWRCKSYNRGEKYFGKIRQ